MPVWCDVDVQWSYKSGYLIHYYTNIKLRLFANANLPVACQRNAQNLLVDRVQARKYACHY